MDSLGPGGSGGHGVWRQEVSTHYGWLGRHGDPAVGERRRRHLEAEHARRRWHSTRLARILRTILLLKGRPADSLVRSPCSPPCRTSAFLLRDPLSSLSPLCSKPFLITYLCTATFTLYLVRPVCKHLMRQRVQGAGLAGYGSSVAAKSSDELATCVGPFCRRGGRANGFMDAVDTCLWGHT